jgi:hypothetical protein
MFSKKLLFRLSPDMAMDHATLIDATEIYPFGGKHYCSRMLSGDDRTRPRKQSVKYTKEARWYILETMGRNMELAAAMERMWNPAKETSTTDQLPHNPSNLLKIRSSDAHRLTGRTSSAMWRDCWYGGGCTS